MSEGAGHGEQLDFSAVTSLSDESELLKQKIESALAASKRAAERRETSDSRGRRPAPRRPSVVDTQADESHLGTDEAAPALSIAQFYDRVRRALLDEFPEDIWVMGEIRSIRERKGHHYIELADAGSERTTAAQLEVVCWAREWPRVRGQLADAQVTLEPGRVVRVRGRVSVWEGGSKIRFSLIEIDIASLLGGIAAARRKLLAALEAEGLLEANRRLEVPLVPLRVGLVTSAGSEGHNDFAGQLERSGFAFTIAIEATLVQGLEAPAQISGALCRLRAFPIDLAVVVRGGGSRGDLAAFDSEEVARAIATSPFPVWTGIGHTGDRSVADEVANRSCITPTQCGEAVVARVAEYHDAVATSAYEITRIVSSGLTAAEHALSAATGSLVRIVRHELEWKAEANARSRVVIARGVAGAIERGVSRLSQFRGAIAAATKRLLISDEREMHRRRLVLRAYDPVRQLERGWSLTFGPDGKSLRSIADLKPGAEITTRLRDGQARSVIRSTLKPQKRGEEDE
ncbi:MAG: exodeoxyribonuclease VII large subunit [Acidimicrobiales bacterium]